MHSDIREGPEIFVFERCPLSPGGSNHQAESTLGVREYKKSIDVFRSVQS